MKPPLPHDRKDWQALSALIGLVSVTGMLEGQRPQSIMVVGAPASGKSVLLERYLARAGDLVNPHLQFTTSVTQMGIRQILAKQHRPTHLVVPEFQTLILRKSHVWDTLLGILLPAMEEGITDFWSGAEKVQFHGAKIGLIAAMTTAALQEHQEMLTKSGFLSRMLVVHLNRSPDDALRARKCANAGDHSELRKIHVSLPSRPVRVSLSRRLADRIDDYAAQLNPHELHRESNRFQALTRAVAYVQGSREAQGKHFDWLLQWEELWRTR